MDYGASTTISAACPYHENDEGSANSSSAASNYLDAPVNIPSLIVLANQVLQKHIALQQQYVLHLQNGLAGLMEIIFLKASISQRDNVCLTC